jgi:hypothetical protein
MSFLNWSLVKRITADIPILAVVILASFSNSRSLTEAIWLLGAFAKLREATVSFVMSVCLSVRSYGTTRLPLDGFLWYLIFEYFFENLSRKFKCHWNMTRITVPLHEDLCTFMISRSIVLRMRNVSDKHCRENQSTHLIFTILFFRKSCRLWDNVEKWLQPDRPQMTM